MQKRTKAPIDVYERQRLEAKVARREQEQKRLADERRRYEDKIAELERDRLEERYRSLCLRVAVARGLGTKDATALSNAVLHAARKPRAEGERFDPNYEIEQRLHELGHSALAPAPRNPPPIGSMMPSRPSSKEEEYALSRAHHERVQGERQKRDALMKKLGLTDPTLGVLGNNPGGIGY